MGINSASLNGEMFFFKERILFKWLHTACRLASLNGPGRALAVLSESDTCSTTASTNGEGRGASGGGASGSKVGCGRRVVPLDSVPSVVMRSISNREFLLGAAAARFTRGSDRPPLGVGPCSAPGDGERLVVVIGSTFGVTGQIGGSCDGLTDRGRSNGGHIGDPLAVRSGRLGSLLRES
jgi:hypothetical protein